MALKIKKTRKLEKISYTEDGMTANFQVRKLTQAETQECIDEATVFQWDAPDENTKKERFERVNHIEFLKRRFIKSVQSWDVEDEDGTLLECNDANKGIVFDNYPQIPAHINKAMREIEEAEAKKRSDELGNS